MQISKQQVLDHLKGHGQDDKVQQADQLLPDTVDTDQHADKLGQLGINPADLLGGGAAGGIGDKLGL
jgi:hypothetical protein